MSICAGLARIAAIEAGSTGYVAKNVQLPAERLLQAVRPPERGDLTGVTEAALAGAFSM
jgi:hypothetical protein